MGCPSRSVLKTPGAGIDLLAQAHCPKTSESEAMPSTSNNASPIFKKSAAIASHINESQTNLATFTHRGSPAEAGRSAASDPHARGEVFM
jgi:hypothetical protein